MLGGLCFLLAVLAQDPSIDSLIRQLSDDSIEVREKAGADLIALGDKAQERLRKEASTAEGELKARIEGLLKTIDRNLRLRAILPEFKRVTLSAKDKPLKEVLEELKTLSGLPLDTAHAGADKISIAVKDATPFEALDAICRAADLEFLPDDSDHPMMAGEDSTPAIKLRSGHTKSPRSFSGHFVLFASEVRLTQVMRFGEAAGADRAGGDLSLKLYYHPALRPTRLAEFTISTITDDKGTDLNRRAEQGLRPMDPDEDLDVELKRPAVGAARIAVVTGSMKVLLAVGETVVGFDKPLESKGQTREFDGVTFKLEDCVQEDKDVRIKMTTSGRRKSAPKHGMDHFGRGFSLDYDKIVFKTEDGKGSTRGHSFSGSGSGKNQMTYNLSFQGVNSPVTYIGFTVDTDYHEEKLDFALKDIPLPK